jgi:hypothetical protein
MVGRGFRDANRLELCGTVKPVRTYSGVMGFGSLGSALSRIRTSIVDSAILETAHHPEGTA